MTEEREEILLTTVGEMKGLLERFVKQYDSDYPSFAKKIDFVTVDDKIKAHIKKHVSNKILIPTWVGVVVALGVGIASLFK